MGAGLKRIVSPPASFSVAWSRKGRRGAAGLRERRLRCEIVERVLQLRPVPFVCKLFVYVLVLCLGWL